MIASEPAELLQYRQRLRFPHDLERTYQQDMNEKMMRISRPGTALAILVYSSFWILDLFALPIAYRQIWLIRVLGIILMTVFFSYRTLTGIGGM